MSMKKTIAILLLLCFLLPLAGCAGKQTAPTPWLRHNVARLFAPLSRESRFMIDAKAVEGSAAGKAAMDTSADGRTALAWVDTAVWYVSEKGVDPLGTGIGSAELSFDGRYAAYLEGDELKLFDGQKRTAQTIEGGIASLVQVAFSPNSGAFAYTVCFTGDLTRRVTKLSVGGEVSEPFPGRNTVVLAVSDDASVIWFLEGAELALRVRVNGEERDVSSEVGAATSFNFTNDLSEAAFGRNDGTWALYRISDGSTKELGGGYQFTLKTDIYSINMITAIVYINDIDTFTGGFWLKRSRDANDDYVYELCLMDENGGLTRIAGDVREYAAAPDGSGVYYNAEGVVSFADIKGETKEIFPMASGLALTDGGVLYSLNAAFGVSVYDGAEKSVELPGGDAASVSAIGSVGLAIDADGALYSLNGTKITKLMDNVTRMDKRAGQVIIYAEPAEIEGEVIYNVYMTADGERFELQGRGIQP